MEQTQLTTYTKARLIRRSLITRAAEILITLHWTDSFCITEIRNIIPAIKKWEEDYGSFKINPTDLTLKEMEDLEFDYYKHLDIWLIPFYLYPFLADEFESRNITGTWHNKLSEIESDHDFGYLSYGVKPKKDFNFIL